VFLPGLLKNVRHPVSVRIEKRKPGVELIVAQFLAIVTVAV
jgi:hypothetical protein